MEKAKTLRQVIREEGLDPIVIRDNWKNAGDNWRIFFKPNLRESTRKIVDNPCITQWETESGIILEDNLRQSLLATDRQALVEYKKEGK